jgi:hypothetical protein
VVLEDLGKNGAWGGYAKYKHPVLDLPGGRCRGLDVFGEQPIHLRSLVSGERGHGGFQLVGRKDCQHGRAEIVETVVGDERGDPLLECSRPGREHAAHADTHQCEFFGVDARETQREVYDGRHDLLPVRSEGQPFPVHRPVLPRAVEGKHVVAALYRGACAFGMHFLSRTVETGMDNEQRALAPRVVDAMEISGKRGVLIGNLDRFNGGSYRAQHAL